MTRELPITSRAVFINENEGPISWDLARRIIINMIFC